MMTLVLFTLAQVLRVSVLITLAMLTCAVYVCLCISAYWEYLLSSTDG